MSVTHKGQAKSTFTANMRFNGRSAACMSVTLLRVSTAWIRRLVQRRRETGAIAPKPLAGGPAPALGPADRDRLRALVERQPDATLAELRDRLAGPGQGHDRRPGAEGAGPAAEKSRTGRPSRAGRTWPGGGPSTGPRSRALTRGG